MNNMNLTQEQRIKFLRGLQRLNEVFHQYHAPSSATHTSKGTKIQNQLITRAIKSPAATRERKSPTGVMPTYKKFVSVKTRQHGNYDVSKAYGHD
jgi:hypothetical protein